MEFSYKGERRLVEPYSLRRKRTGNLLLYAHDMRANDIRAFKVADIRDLRVTTDSFAPRHRVEFLSTGAITVGESAPRTSYTFRYASSRPRTRSYVRTGPTYVYTCTHCQKEFRHSRRNDTLRRHKSPLAYGYCAGLRGYLDRIDY